MNLHTRAIRTAGVAITLCGMVLPSIAYAAPYGTGRSSETERRVERKEYVSTRHAIFLRGQRYFTDGDDIDKAAKLWRKAAEMCDTDAQSSLGYLYYIGMGVNQSYARALKWYHRAARAGSSEAQYSLANMYYRGQGKPKSIVRAMAWFGVALANGNSDAAEELRFTEKHATPEQVSEARRLARKLRGMHRSEACIGAPGLKAADKLLAENIQ